MTTGTGPPAAPEPPANLEAPQPARLPVAFGRHGMELRSFDDLYRFATLIAKTDFAPKDMRGKPADIMAAVQLGAEVGLGPVQAMQNIAVINGRPSIWGDSMLALCQANPRFAHAVFAEWFEGTPYNDEYTAHCRVGRLGVDKPIVASFSVSDAKRAKLWGKPSPWTTYPKRMLQMRARAFALRNGFADILKGLWSREEMIDVVPVAAEDVPSPTVSQIETALTSAPAELPAPPAAEPVAEVVVPAVEKPKARGKKPGTLSEAAEEQKAASELALHRTAIVKAYAHLSDDRQEAFLKNCSLKAIEDLEAIDDLDKLRSIRDASMGA